MVVQSSISYCRTPTFLLTPPPVLSRWHLGLYWKTSRDRGFTAFTQWDYSILTRLKLLESPVYEPISLIFWKPMIGWRSVLCRRKTILIICDSTLNIWKEFQSHSTPHRFLFSRKPSLHDLLIVLPVMWFPRLLATFSFSS